MFSSLNEKIAKELCLALLGAESEEEILRILKNYGYWNDQTAWRLFGDNENNFSIIGNQQSSPVAAMVEKFINSVDAVLMLHCYLEGLDPEDPRAPRSITEALERYFGVKDGNLANVGALQRTRLANHIGFVATGRRQTPNYTVFDRGEGQSPSKMPDTFLSLAKSNKLRIPFVQGKFNMGGTGVLQFCGRHNFQLIISRRHPQIADLRDPFAAYWGFTIVRREDPSAGRRNSTFTYLAPGGTVPHFRSESIQIPDNGLGTQPLPALEWGTIIKMFEYEMTGFKTNILLDFYNQVSLLVPRIGLPIRFYERRGYPGHSLETTMSGLHVRLEEDKRENLENGFPTHVEIRVMGEAMRASIYAFRKGGAEKYRKNEGIIFTVNGQTHGLISQNFFSRRSVGMSYLADSILVIVDCDRISGRAREDLFMNSRDRLRSGELRAEIERTLERILHQHQGLRELRERRRREEIENRLAGARPLRDILNKILKKSPALTALFTAGGDISNPFRSRNAGEQEKFEGRPHPTYFFLRKGEESKNCHIGQRFRVQFETDVVNDYFGRDQYPGEFTLHINGRPTEEYTLNLWNGVATLNVSLPAWVQVGDDLYCEAWVTDETLIEPFYNTFTRHVLSEVSSQPGRAGQRRPPVGPGNGDRSLPEGLNIPEVIEVREEEWERHGFDKYSALKVVDTGEGSYDFFVNMDNVYLLSEIKEARESDPRMLEARFKHALVLVGLALLKEQENRERMVADRDRSVEDVEDRSETMETRIFEVTRAVAPILLPMINILGDLEIEEEPADEMPEREA